MAIDGAAVKNSSLWDFKGAVDYVDGWLFMGSPHLMLTIVASYLYFVLKYGPQYMKNQPAYKLRRLLLLYNAFQVAFSFYLFYIGTEIILENGLLEKECLIENDAKKYRIVRGIYLYFLAKMSEFMDTIFFVLRKKWNQISFLHVYHHFIMFTSAWVTLKYDPTYSIVFLGTINSFVHVIMYGYYGLSAFPKLQKYLWWKRYITKMQLIQFVLVVIQVTSNYYVTPCKASYILLSIVWFHGFLFVYLFSDFYVKSYLQKRKDTKEKMTAFERDSASQKVLDKSR
ncbi:GNS1/SUR4 family domain-containing protein [Phthorimaea operculella]|nr:GNS1/SUR4 family domain-containing protein [Phthorimaea operculella]